MPRPRCLPVGITPFIIALLDLLLLGLIDLVLLGLPFVGCS